MYGWCLCSIYPFQRTSRDELAYSAPGVRISFRVTRVPSITLYQTQTTFHPSKCLCPLNSYHECRTQRPPTTVFTHILHIRFRCHVYPRSCRHTPPSKNNPRTRRSHMFLRHCRRPPIRSAHCIPLSFILPAYGVRRSWSHRSQLMIPTIPCREYPQGRRKAVRRSREHSASMQSGGLG